MGTRGEPSGGRRKREDRAAAIAAAALAEFADKGFAAARIDDIAQRAGISKGTVYLYFDSKEALFEEVVRRHIVPRVERIAASGATEGSTAEEGLRSLVQGIYRELADGDLRYILRLLVSEGGRFPHLVTVYYNEVIARGLAGMCSVIARGVTTGEFRPTALVEFPQVVIGPAIMAAIWKLLFERLHPLDLDAMREAHLDVMLRGLRKR